MSSFSLDVAVPTAKKYSKVSAHTYLAECSLTVLRYPTPSFIWEGLFFSLAKYLPNVHEQSPKEVAILSSGTIVPQTLNKVRIAWGKRSWLSSSSELRSDSVSGVSWSAEAPALASCWYEKSLLTATST